MSGEATNQGRDAVQLRAGSRLRSAVDTTEVVVVRAPAEDVEVRCGGQPMVALDADVAGGTPDAEHADGTQLGKRYVGPGGSFELLCTKAGDGSLSVGDVSLELKEAKPLPASD
ncbi:MAG TPA: hypothetical protein VK611_13260 [Acidimicrobiales bacterium]|nr:hypothetical protein [Acidimicrobiales bacterium]